MSKDKKVPEPTSQNEDNAANQQASAASESSSSIGAATPSVSGSDKSDIESQRSSVAANNLSSARLVATQYVDYLQEHNFFGPSKDYKFNSLPYFGLAIMGFAINPAFLLSIPVIYIVNELILKAALSHSLNNLKINAKYFLKKSEITADDIYDIALKTVAEDNIDTDKGYLNEGDESKVIHYLMTHKLKSEVAYKYKDLSQEILKDKVIYTFVENLHLQNILLNKNYEKTAEYLVNLSGALVLSYYLYNNTSKLNNIASVISNLFEKTISTISSEIHSDIASSASAGDAAHQTADLTDLIGINSSGNEI